MNSPDDCIVCPPGYYCNGTGIGDYSIYACPPGFFCSGADFEAEPCPEGTYRPTPGGANISDCKTCPPGNYCPRETSVFYECPKVMTEMYFHEFVYFTKKIIV
jgi:hypothetical protein